MTLSSSSAPDASEFQAPSCKLEAPRELELRSRCGFSRPLPVLACSSDRPTPQLIGGVRFSSTLCKVCKMKIWQELNTLSDFAAAQILTSSYAFKQRNEETEFPSITCYALKCFVLLLSRRHPQPPSTFLPGSGTGGSSRLLCIDFRLVLFLIFYLLSYLENAPASCPHD